MSSIPGTTLQEQLLLGHVVLLAKGAGDRGLADAWNAFKASARLGYHIVSARILWAQGS